MWPTQFCRYEERLTEIKAEAPVAGRGRVIRWLLGGAALVLAVGLTAVVLEPTRVLYGWLAGERFFDGRPTSYWERELCAREPSARTNALNRLVDGGAAVVPVAQELFARGDTRWTAVQILAQIGPEAKAALPELIVALEDDDPLVRELAFRALSRLGPDAAPAAAALAARLRTGDRLLALRTLQELRGGARQAVVEVRNALRDADAEVRWNAAEVLARIGPAREAIPELRAGLDDKDAKVRWHVAEALGKMGGFAKEALPGLRKLLQDPDDRVRQEARRAIIRIDPAALLESR